MIRMIQLVATVALALTLAACDGSDNNREEVEELKTALAEAEEKVMTLETALAEAGASKAEVETALEAVQGKVMELEAALAEAEEKVTAQEMALAEAGTSKAELETALEAAQGRVMALEATLAEAQEKVTTLETALEATGTSEAQMEAAFEMALKAAQEKVTTLEMALADALAGTETLGIYDAGAIFNYDTDYGEAYVREVVGETTHRGRRVVEMTTNLQLPEDSSCHGNDADYLDWETGSWVACLRDGEVLAEMIPHYGDRRFPLSAGDTWSIEVEYVDHVNPDYSSAYTQTWEVEACNVELTVPAGTFSTCRVSSGNEAYWYTIEHGLFLKYVGSGVDVELSDYDLTP